MKRNTNNYIDNTYRTLETEYPEDELVIEGREEILLILTALRRGTADMKTLARRIWKSHTGFGKCKCCGGLTKWFYGGYYVLHRGYKSVCQQCEARFCKEYQLARQQSESEED